MVGVSRGAIWFATLLAVIATGIGYGALGVSLDLSHTAASLSAMVATAGLMLLRPRFHERALGRFVDMMELLLLFAVVSAAGALASYVVVMTSSGYVDETMAGIDRGLGFDWKAFYDFTATHSWYWPLSRFFYCSIFNTPFLLIGTLAWTDRADRGRQFLMAFTVALAITIVLFHWFPARGTLAFYGARADYLPVVSWGEAETIPALRAGVPSVDVSLLTGIVNFPSFHAASAILFIWGAWSVKPLRWIVLVTNVAMLIATPVEGTHYLIDVIGGISVASVAIGLLYLPNLWPLAAVRQRSREPVPLPA